MRDFADKDARAAAIIVAAGESTRFGGGSKPFVMLHGRPMVSWSLDAAQSCSNVDEIILVANESAMSASQRLCSGGEWGKLSRITPGGATRQQSVQRGLAKITGDAKLAVIHDAARPLVSAAMFSAVIIAAAETGAAITASPVVDTLKRVVDGFVASTVSRDDLWSAQTPQAFSINDLRRAFDNCVPAGVTDEAMLFEYGQLPVVIVPGSSNNLKVTYPGDLVVAEALLAMRDSSNEQLQ